MSSIFDKWNEKINNDFFDELDKAEAGQSDYRDVPPGKYEVKINKMELKESKAGSPMLAIQFRVLQGEYKGNLIFMNQVIETPFQIHMANELLRDLDTELDVIFRDYNQYNQLILDIEENISAQKLEYVLIYGKNNKGFPTFEIDEVFESEAGPVDAVPF